MVLVHSLQTHKEYRYIFAVIPLWLLVGADLAARLAALGDGRRHLAGVAAAGFAAVSLAGILNALPYQDRVYRAWSRETGAVNFVRNQDPIFPAYRYLARALPASAESGRSTVAITISRPTTTCTGTYPSTTCHRGGVSEGTWRRSLPG